MTTMPSALTQALPPRSPNVTLLVANPRPHSRTASAARTLGERLCENGRRPAADLVDLGSLSTHPSGPGTSWTWPDDAINRVANAAEVVLASPTYKGSFTGLLKTFLDQLPPGALRGAWVHILIVGASPRHASAGDGDLRRVVAELGGAAPAPALFLTEPELEDINWAEAWWQKWAWAYAPAADPSHLPPS